MVETYADDQVSPLTCTHRDEVTGRRCTGNRVEGFEGCLAHLKRDQLNQVLQRFRPQNDLNLTGTPIEGG